MPKLVLNPRHSLLGLGPVRIPASEKLSEERKREFVNRQLEARMDLYLEKLGKLGLAQKLGRLGVKDFMVDDSGAKDPKTGKSKRINWTDADDFLFVRWVDSYLDDHTSEQNRTKDRDIIDACERYRDAHLPRTAGITAKALATRYRQLKEGKSSV